VGKKVSGKKSDKVSEKMNIKVSNEVSSKEDLLLSEEVISEQELLQQVRERSLLLNSTLLQDLDRAEEDNKQDKQENKQDNELANKLENKLTNKQVSKQVSKQESKYKIKRENKKSNMQENSFSPGEKAGEISEMDSRDSELFPMLMLMSMDNKKRPADAAKTKKAIYNDISVDLERRDYKNNKKGKENLMNIEFSQNNRANKLKKKKKTKTSKTNLDSFDITGRKPALKRVSVKSWFTIKAEVEAEEIMDIYYCKNITSKWKLPL